MHPVFRWLGYSVRSYPIVVTAGVLLCWALLLVRTGRRGYRRGDVLLWVMFAFPVGALGAMALAKAVHLFAGQDLLGEGGLTVLGALVACVGFSALYVPRVFGERPWRLLDQVAFSYPLALGIGRVGCLLTGCCFGVPAGPTAPGWLTLPLSAYDPGSLAAVFFRAAPATLRVWNLPLLFILNCAIALVLVELVYRRRARWRLPDGVTFAAAVVLETAGRLAIETLRADPTSALLRFNPWRGIDALVLLAGIGFLVLRRPARALEAGLADPGR